MNFTNFAVFSLESIYDPDNHEHNIYSKFYNPNGIIRFFKYVDLFGQKEKSFFSE